MGKAMVGGPSGGPATARSNGRDRQGRQTHQCRGCHRTLAGARVFCRGHALLRNLRGGFYDLGRLIDAAVLAPQPPVVRAWATLTSALLGR